MPFFGFLGGVVLAALALIVIAGIWRCRTTGTPFSLRMLPKMTYALAALYLMLLGLMWLYFFEDRFIRVANDYSNADIGNIAREFLFEFEERNFTITLLAFLAGALLVLATRRQNSSPRESPGPRAEAPQPTQVGQIQQDQEILAVGSRQLRRVTAFNAILVFLVVLIALPSVLPWLEQRLDYIKFGSFEARLGGGRSGTISATAAQATRSHVEERQSIKTWLGYEPQLDVQMKMLTKDEGVPIDIKLFYELEEVIYAYTNIVSPMVGFVADMEETYIDGYSILAASSDVAMILEFLQENPTQPARTALVEAALLRLVRAGEQVLGTTGFGCAEFRRVVSDTGLHPPPLERISDTPDCASRAKNMIASLRRLRACLPPNWYSRDRLCNKTNSSLIDLIVADLIIYASNDRGEAMRKGLAVIQRAIRRNEYQIDRIASDNRKIDLSAIANLHIKKARIIFQMRWSARELIHSLMSAYDAISLRERDVAYIVERYGKCSDCYDHTNSQKELDRLNTAKIIVVNELFTTLNFYRLEGHRMLEVLPSWKTEEFKISLTKFAGDHIFGGSDKRLDALAAGALANLALYEVINRRAGDVDVGTCQLAEERLRVALQYWQFRSNIDDTSYDYASSQYPIVLTEKQLVLIEEVCRGDS